MRPLREGLQALRASVCVNKGKRVRRSCAACGTTKDLTVDHKNPATRGQPGLMLQHVQVFWPRCNSRKGDRHSARGG